jgi:RimJ/RimL family protein N-acetyltransferase
MKLVARTLKDRFVRLELLSESHREALRPLADDPQLWVQTTLNASGAGFDPWFDTMLEASRSDRQISFAVVDAITGRYAGHSAYLCIEPAHARVEIGWTWYGAEFHRTHVNPAAKRQLLNHAFGCGAARVELKTGSQNLRSQGAMEKLGAVREGVLRSHAMTWTGARRDSVYFSVLAAEWPGVVAGLDVRLVEAAP